jgi:hypothetical protein
MIERAMIKRIGLARVERLVFDDERSTDTTERQRRRRSFTNHVRKRTTTISFSSRLTTLCRNMFDESIMKFVTTADDTTRAPFMTSTVQTHSIVLDVDTVNLHTQQHEQHVRQLRQVKQQVHERRCTKSANQQH